jgi:steroid delta-isomerase-like uncharacterized protein
MADLKELCRRFNDEILSQGKIEVIDELVDDDLVEHQEFPGVASGKAGITQFVKMFRDAFPDLKVTTDAVVVEGDEAWMQSTMTGTHKGEFAGIPATGKKISVTVFDRVKIRDGKAIEHWGVSDDMGMMTQLGVIPEMG